ncbi:MAG: FMN-binding protein [Rhodoluna sp.]|nr:FMN-binding protein [Rhodoluna sp.]
MESSNLYTFQKPIEGKRRYRTSTIVLTLLSLLGAVGIDLWLNPNALSMFAGTPSPSNVGGISTATGESVESGYGPVQVMVTKEAGKITAIDLVRAQSTGGRDAAFPLLVKAAIAANGSNIGNVSQATYSSDAFKKSLDSALAKIK